jgi:hypothetical protein
MKTLPDIAAMAESALLRAGTDPATASTSGAACAFLEACGYPGLKLLAEALDDKIRSLLLTRDALGLDLQHVSCVFIGPAVAAEVETNGRAFLRNVRHGLYLVPPSVIGNYGIGCPIDPAFPLGGERSKNPYAEKLALAEQTGIAVDASLWQSLSS